MERAEGAALDRPGGPGSSRIWRALVPVTSLMAGFLFATSAATASGTDLRAGRRTQLAELISAQQRAVVSEGHQASVLRAALAQVQDRVAAGDSHVAAERARGDDLARAAGLVAATGPGLTVALTDAARRDGLPLASDNPDDLVVHQQDVQAVVNALWAGGAEAMTLMGQRVISTSAVRCVGNTLVLQGRVYSPPFVISAIGDRQRLEQALAQSPGVEFFRTFVDQYGLGYVVRSSPDLHLPAYEGLLDLPHVTVPA